MKRGAICLLLAACGRVGFDPLADGVDAPLADTSLVDTAASTCDGALLVGIGRTPVVSTCSQGDRVDGCAAAGVSDLLVKFIAPANAGYQFAAMNPGTMNVSNSISRVDASCGAATQGCAGILSFSMTAGQIVFLVVEADQGGCVDVEIDVR